MNFPRRDRLQRANDAVALVVVRCPLPVVAVCAFITLQIVEFQSSYRRRHERKDDQRRMIPGNAGYPVPASWPLNLLKRGRKKENPLNAKVYLRKI